MREFYLFVGVVILIGGAFLAGLTMYVPHQTHALAQPAAIFAGFTSALSWGLSVVGALLGGSRTIMGSVVWNSWFNCIAAALAALAVGLAAPWAFAF